MIHPDPCPDLIVHARRTLDELPQSPSNLEAFCIEAERDWEAEQRTAVTVIEEATSVAVSYWAVVDGHPDFEDAVDAAKWEADRWASACE